MSTYFLTLGEEPPPKHEAPRVGPQGFGVAQAWTGLEHNDTTICTRWAAYAACRRLRRKCSGCRWPAEIVA